MKEYLFYRNHKKELATGGGHCCGGYSTRSSISVSTAASNLDTISQRREKTILNLSHLSEFSEETLKDSFDHISKQYTDEFSSAGFPPKICSELVDQLSTGEKLKSEILDVGCGNGYVGQYLRQIGYRNIHGIDCSRIKLQEAEKKASYQSLQRGTFGLKDSKIPESFLEKFDFVTCASLANNYDLDGKIFLDLLSTVRVGGSVIFAPKLDTNNICEYAKQIDELTDEGYWTFTTDHSFYRYDKLFGGIGKFSNKLVKILVYQKRDRAAFLMEREAAAKKADEERIAAQTASKRKPAFKF